MRSELNANRKRIREVLYKQFFFIIRAIQDQSASGPNHDITIEWTAESTPAENTVQMGNPTTWEIPLTHAPDDIAPDMTYENMAAYAKMMSDFIQEKLRVNFHDLAWAAMAMSLPESTRDPVAAILALSPLSLRAIHIWAMGLRALSIEVTGGPPVSDAEKAAAKGVTPLANIDHAQNGLSILLLGTIDKTVADPAQGHTHKVRNSFDRSLFGCSFNEYLEDKNKKAGGIYSLDVRFVTTPPPTESESSVHSDTEKSDDDTPPPYTGTTTTASGHPNEDFARSSTV